MRKVLHPGDRVIYKLHGHNFHGTVADYLPLKTKGEDMIVPIFKRSELITTDFKRSELRKTR